MRVAEQWPPSPMQRAVHPACKPGYMSADERRDAAVRHSPHSARSSRHAISGDEPSPVAPTPYAGRRPRPPTVGGRRTLAAAVRDREVCGSTNAFPSSPSKVCPDQPVHSGDLLCSVCHRQPPEKQGDEPFSHHLADDEAIADAAEF